MPFPAVLNNFAKIDMHRSIPVIIGKMSKIDICQHCGPELRNTTPFSQLFHDDSYRKVTWQGYQSNRLNGDVAGRTLDAIYKTHMSLKIRTEAHARKKKSGICWHRFHGKIFAGTKAVL
jgi:hypothetical protein